MDMRDLAYFEIIAETGHLGRAAERLGRTKPALTKAVRRLEHCVGTALFERVGRGIRLTCVGEVLLSRARLLRGSMLEAEREVKDFAEGSLGHMRVGVSAVAAESLLPEVGAGFLQRAPGASMEVLVGMGDLLRMRLRQGRLDLVISSTLRTDDDEFAVYDLADDDVVVVARRGHALAGRPVDLQELGRQNWLLPARSVASRQWLEQVFASRGLPALNVQVETTSMLSLLHLVARTELLGFVSTRSLELSPETSLVQLDVDEARLHRRLGLLHRRACYLPPVVTKFIEILTEMQSEGAAWSRTADPP